MNTAYIYIYIYILMHIHFSHVPPIIQGVFTHRELLRADECWLILWPQHNKSGPQGRKLGGDAGKILGIRTPQWIRFWLGKIIGMTLRHWYVGKVFKGHVAGSMSRMWSIDLNKFRLDGVFLVWLCDIKVWKTWETTMVTAEWQK